MRKASMPKASGHKHESCAANMRIEESGKTNHNFSHEYVDQKQNYSPGHLLYRCLCSCLSLSLF